MKSKYLFIGYDPTGIYFDEQVIIESETDNINDLIEAEEIDAEEIEILNWQFIKNI